MEQKISNETIASLFSDLGVETSTLSLPLQTLGDTNSKYLRDLKLNVNGMLGAKNLTKKEAYFIAYAVAVNEKCEPLVAAFAAMATKEGATADELAEVAGCVSIMNVNNVFYRFRHYMKPNEYYEKTPAGMRMSIMMNPIIGKGLFELISLVISAVNGCERCVQSHEHSVKEQGADEPRIFDAIRLGAVIKGLAVLV